MRDNIGPETSSKRSAEQNPVSEPIRQTKEMSRCPMAVLSHVLLIALQIQSSLDQIDESSPAQPSPAQPLPRYSCLHHRHLRVDTTSPEEISAMVQSSKGEENVHVSLQGLPAGKLKQMSAPCR